MRIGKQLGQILQFLAERQGENGEFRSLESYPAEHPLGDKGWFYTDPSPFVHANILCAISGLSDPMAMQITKQGCHFLLHQMEWKGLWRFWTRGGQTHNVPIDLDDTALCSFALASGGFPLDNKKYILQNLNSDGYFFTWLLPRFGMWRYPALYRFLKKDLQNIQLVLASPMLSLDDFEPAVAANVLLYLGETPKTRLCILQILQQLEKTDSMPLQYYADPLVVFYHVSRAYYHGVKGLAPAADIFRRVVAQGVFPEPENLFKKAMMAATCLHFNLAIQPDIDKWIAEIGEAAENAQWESHIYFVSKDRNFRAGSPELTAAFCAEALSLYQAKKETVYSELNR